MKCSGLWNRNFQILTLASIMGAAGGIAGSYAMRFLVYEETGSTLAAGILTGLAVIPQFVLPIAIAPLMDRCARKPFLVFGDLISGALYLLAGLYLTQNFFSYNGYLIFSLFLAAIGAMDTLAYNSIFPGIIPKGYEEKGYAVAAMLYPLMNVVIMPLSGLMMKYCSVAHILIIQGLFSILAGLLENQIIIEEKNIKNCKKSGFTAWYSDLKDGIRYVSGERGLKSIFGYMAFTNAVAMGQLPVLVAFFSMSPGFSPFMYGFFSFAEFSGRTLGGIFRYRVSIPQNKRFRFVFLVYVVYEMMDMVLLWLPYPWMLLNRSLCGFLGFNSATERTVAIQSYIPEEYRARVNAFETAIVSAAASIMAIAVGWIGDLVCPELAMTITGALCFAVCLLTIWKNRNDILPIYDSY